MSHLPTTEPPRETSAPERRRIDRSFASLFASFGYAFNGIRHLFRSQRNAQIHCLIGACALALGAVLRIARWEWLALILTITLVLAAEAFNTAIEAAVDVATRTRHPLARVAKDVGAGAVLLCAIGAVASGCIIFIPHLWPILVQLFTCRMQLAGCFP